MHPNSSTAFTNVLITHMLPNGKLLRRVMNLERAELYMDAIENSDSDWTLMSVEAL